MGFENALQIPVGKIILIGDRKIPKDATGIVLFAHGSGSGRHSPRNQYVAKMLQEAGLATLLIDLLTEEEEKIDDKTAQLRFDIEMLGKRLEELTDWIARQSETNNLAIGYFGASTGAAAALVAAAKKGSRIGAVVSRGGRPDLAGASLGKVKAPTLLIVGGNDFPVIQMNEEAMRKLHCEKKLVVVSHATHLFEEEGALEEVAKLAQEWFKTHLEKKA